MSSRPVVVLPTTVSIRTSTAIAVVLALAVVFVGQAASAPDSTGARAGSADASGSPPAVVRVGEAEPAPVRGPRDKPAIVVAAGDISDCAPPNCAAARTASLVRRIDPTRVLTLGDTQYSRGSFAEFTREYDKTWGTFLRRTRPVLGNHEYLTPGASGYYRYFGEQAHRAHQGYYSYAIDRWHMVALNSNDGDCTIVGCEAGSRQLDWLRSDLRANPRRCVLAYWHHPPWASAGYGGNRQVRDMWRVLARAGADVVLNGHDHNYERFAPRNGAGTAARRGHGVRQFIVGTGGVALNRLTDRNELSRRIIDDHHGVLKLALGTNYYRFRFVAANGHVLDESGPISCS